jgi:hypothetical protein
MDSSSLPSGTLEAKAITGLCFVLNKKVDKGGFVARRPLCNHRRNDQVQVKFDVMGICHAMPQKQSESGLSQITVQFQI